ncbi:MAG TPA: serine hydrolase domain-containing protein [Ilumatobacteraceae bacterium]|nr:serine hydrolase domain-containing protein [Ilumatobacteraceae bacterium]
MGSRRVGVFAAVLSLAAVSSCTDAGEVTTTTTTERAEAVATVAAEVESVARMSEAAALGALSGRADALADTDEFSGAVLVARDGKVLLEDAWGLADRESGTPNTPDTKFRVGSLNKMFTAIATLQLVEAGQLELDDTIGEHLVDYPNEEVAANVTVLHLLTHAGGTGDIFGAEFDSNRLELREHQDYVDLFGPRPLAFEPGTSHEYSNYGFVLLGALIEAVTGQSYYDYVRTNVFEPAGMTSTDSLPETDDVPNRAVGYTDSDDGWTPNTDALLWRGIAAGGGYSTVGDLMRFAQALSAGTLISQAMLAEATRAQAPGYGFGFQLGRDPVLFYGHHGGSPGVSSALRVYPELGYVVVGLSNLDEPAANNVVDYFTLRMPVAE